MLFAFSDHIPDEQLFSIMEAICGLVDSIPEHELIALSCGSELLLKRAQRYVHLSGKKSFVIHFENKLIEVICLSHAGRGFLQLVVVVY